MKKIKKTILIFIILIVICLGVIGVYLVKQFSVPKINTIEEAIEYSNKKDIKLNYEYILGDTEELIDINVDKEQILIKKYKLIENEEEALSYAKDHNYEVEYNYTYSTNSEYLKYEKLDNKIIIYKNKELTSDLLKQYKVDELGKVPIMMYHNIFNKKSPYGNGNVDKNGYNRTSEAFKKDLEFYYSKGYRFIRLEDYVNGIIDVELGYSPIILTFDDGNDNNCLVTGKDDNGNLIIDPNSAVGIMEEFKKNHPDSNITATFFVNQGLFNQKEYNNEIMNKVIELGYDIGNHTKNHVDFSTINQTKTIEEVGGMYQILEEVIPGKYVNIIALPFGSPYKKNHSNYPYILGNTYNGKEYKNIAALRVGWEPELSPFNKDFDPTFLKRCRAFDTSGVEGDDSFTIDQTFKRLESTKYISDGVKDIISIPKSKKNNISTKYTNLLTY